jgi:hypothetical protein
MPNWKTIMLATMALPATMASQKDDTRTQIAIAIAKQMAPVDAPLFAGVGSSCSSATECKKAEPGSPEGQKQTADARALAVALKANFAGDYSSVKPPSRGEIALGHTRAACADVPLLYVSIGTTGFVEVEPDRAWRVPVVSLRMRKSGCSGSLLEGDFFVRRSDQGVMLVSWVGRRSAMIE